MYCGHISSRHFFRRTFLCLRSSHVGHMKFCETLDFFYVSARIIKRETNKGLQYFILSVVKSYNKQVSLFEKN